MSSLVLVLEHFILLKHPPQNSNEEQNKGGNLTLLTALQK